MNSLSMPVFTGPLPVFVLTGFLGSGKTSLLAGLLGHPSMANTAAVVNELGEIGLDHFLVTTSDEDVVLLNAGCLCCAVLNTLPETLADLYARRTRGVVPSFERVIVETTGLADPGPIIRTLLESPLLAGSYRLDGVITTVDAVFALSQLEAHDETARQICLADRIVLTKTDVSNATKIRAVVERIRTLNPSAPITEIVQGQVSDPAALISPGSLVVPSRADDVRFWLETGLSSPSRAGHDLHHHHDRRVQALSFVLDAPISWAGYACWVDLLKQFDGASLLRMKGLLNILESDRPVVVHAVQHAFYKPRRLDAWPSPDRRSRIVLITWDLDAALVERTLVALTEPPGSTRRMRLVEIRADFESVRTR